VVGLIQVADLGWAERYAYVPFIGLFIAIVWTASEIAERSLWTRWAAGSAMVLGLLAYAGVSHVQIGYWRNSYTLFSHAVAVTSRNAVAETNLGVVYYDSGQLDEAERHYRAALAYRPDLRATRQDLDQVLLREGRVEEALDNDLAACNNLLRYNPNDAGCLRARGTLELRRNQLDAALADLARSVQIWPSVRAYFVLGEVYERKGNLEAAAQCYRKALQIDPNFAPASSRLAALTVKHRPN
jgi:protein O-mannosyl-transferase